MPQRAYLLKGILALGELSVWWGAPKWGKTFLVLRLSYGLALGMGMWGRRARPVRVLYVAAEGVGGIGSRLRALRDELGDVGDRFQLIAQSASLGRPSTDLPALIEAVKVMRAGLVVIDTLARTFGEGDENSATDMGAFVVGVDTLRQQTGAHVLIIHHGTRAGTNSRGSSALDGAADVIVKVERGEEGQPHTASVLAAKDEQDGAVLPFRLRAVDLGRDEDGDERVTCLAEKAEPGMAGKARNARFGRHESILKDAYQRLGGGTLRVAALLDAAVLHMTAPDHGDRDRRRDQARRALDGLIAKRVLFVVGEFVADREPDARWPAKP